MSSNTDPTEAREVSSAIAESPSPSLTIETTKRDEVNVDDSVDREKLSKNQLKKRRRIEKAREAHKRKKMIKKQLKEERAKTEGRNIEKERIIQAKLSLQEDTAAKKKSEKIWKDKCKDAENLFQICVDCSFESLMSSKEINSLANQLRHCYGANKRSKNSVFYTVSSLSGETLQLLNKVNGFPESWRMRAFRSSQESVVDIFPDKSKLIYLTSDSEHTINHLENDKVYVIGGIVDRNRLKRVTIEKAEKLGIQTARLPIDEYLRLFSTKVLTTNHVFEILLKYRQFDNNWKRAMLDVLPTRKDIKEIEGDTNEIEKEGSLEEA